MTITRGEGLKFCDIGHLRRYWHWTYFSLKSCKSFRRFGNSVILGRRYRLPPVVDFLRFKLLKSVKTNLLYFCWPFVINFNLAIFIIRFLCFRNVRFENIKIFKVMGSNDDRSEMSGHHRLRSS